MPPLQASAINSNENGGQSEIALINPFAEPFPQRKSGKPDNNHDQGKSSINRLQSIFAIHRQPRQNCVNSESRPIQNADLEEKVR